MVHPPHFCKLSNTNIGQHFLKLINKHFHKKNLLRSSIGKQSKYAILAQITCTKLSTLIITTFEVNSMVLTINLVWNSL